MKIRLTSSWKILLALTVALVSTIHLSAERPHWEYRGFSVSSAVGPIDETLQHAIAEQIDMVMAVGVKKDVLEFFQAVPFVVISAEDFPKQTPGLYTPADGKVKLTSRITSVGHKPVLLHELLHAYHHRIIPKGRSNPEILTLYQAARKGENFQLRSHMMENPMEFFACAGTAYLFGVTAQEPVSRERLKKQPELLAFLQEMFGPGCGHYEGSLRERVAQPSAPTQADGKPATAN